MKNAKRISPQLRSNRSAGLEAIACFAFSFLNRLLKLASTHVPELAPQQARCPAYYWTTMAVPSIVMRILVAGKRRRSKLGNRPGRLMSGVCAESLMSGTARDPNKGELICALSVLDRPVAEKVVVNLA